MAPADIVLPRPTRAGFLVAWAIFWLLLMTVAVQDHLRQGRVDLWQPLLWEGSSFIVASCIVWLQWPLMHRLDRHLARPWRWFAAVLVWLPLFALIFVAAVYALRHAVYALLGEAYRHDAWAVVFRYETLKFSLFYLLFLALLFGIRSHTAFSTERVQGERARALSQQAQLLQLTQQIEPHFLFNALNTIASTIHSNPELADKLLTRLAALLRAATDLKRRPEVPLAEEMRLLQAYGDIMQERFGERVNLRFDIDPSSTHCTVPTLVLQPLLENAFRHGVEQRVQPSLVVVRSRRSGERLLLEVEDDAGILPAQPRLGVGLSNLQERLALRYGASASLSLSPRASGGVLACIELPCAS